MLEFLLSGGLGTTLLVLVAPLLFRKGRSAYVAFRQHRHTPHRKTRRRPRWNLALLIFASLALLILGIATWPRNIFISLKLPLDASPRSLQAGMAVRFGLNERTHRLLAKLQTLEGRLSYIRLGDAPLLQCSFCQGYTEHALYVLPPRVGAYVTCAAVVGLLADLQWRSLLAYILGIGFVGELVLLLLPDLTATTQKAPLAIILHAARHTLFLSILLASYFLPEQRNPLMEVVPVLQQAVAAQESTAMRLRTHALQHTASMLDADRRRNIDRKWQKSNEVTQQMRKDPQTLQIAERLELKPGGRQRGELEHFVEALTQQDPPHAMDRANDANS